MSDTSAPLRPSARTLAIRRSGPLLLGLALVALLIAPFVLEGYQLFQFCSFFIMAVAVLGLNLLVGYNGQLSLGHGAIYAIGAYVTAIAMEHGGMNWLLALALAALSSMLFGILFGWPALRLKGNHLGLATFALALVAPQLLKHDALSPWTGGVQGLMLMRPMPPEWTGLSGDQFIYLLILGLTVLMFWGASNILRSRIGRAMVAVRENPTAAGAMGVPVARIKVMTFGLSALYTGVAGGLSALLIEFVAPDSFSLMLSILLLVGVVAGGLATLSGAVIGAAFIQLVPTFAEGISKSAPSLVYAGLLLLVVFIMPNGIAGALRSLIARVR